MLVGAAAPQAQSLIFKIHNRERLSLGIPPLRWDDELAADAEQWAEHLATTRTFEHFEEMSDDPDAQGENLWMGTKGAFSPATMVGHWIAEKEVFVRGSFPDNSRTGDVEDVGHYTQIVWRRTERIGCAIADDGQDEYLVCRYAESGNVIGEQPY
ncbi:CAP domain-containing protein [Sphingomonas cavernae]|uniref:SCP-like extracellular n=1 Tax=Sphingomonas cavernae TaxID=2320861 RepID=A0A418WJK5_9SPHN|nr:CAP domain-containing protein [Sphingomonas cavernae]RJF90233.1 SCP-like extracellular [Sphingomonas cavernae]